jgi:NAD(P)-dependent dehydrogenase (short-subunit alcohol dehydrogenase family)
VKAPFRLIREALPHLKATGAGRVVNIASTDAKRFRQGTSVGYSMTKHALLAMTQAVRFAGWDEGVRATALCPGAIDTDLIADLPGVTPKADRLTPETVADMVAFLLSLPNQASVPELVSNTRLENLI